MRSLQKAGSFALIVGVKCLRRTLTKLADIQDSLAGRPAAEAEILAIRIEMDQMQASLRAIKATLGSDDISSAQPLLQ
ncbi:MAG TPA: hypothetical protein VMU50_16700 [Polyangia bacterium]|nr:hypothetical protein [Polyangia bacterium]